MTATATGFDPVPSWTRVPEVTVVAAGDLDAADAPMGVLVAASGAVPQALGVDRGDLAGAGFTGGIGQTLALPRPGGPALIAVGVGDPAELDADLLRDAAAAYARAAGAAGRLVLALDGATGVPPETAGQAAVEGALLARYRFEVLKKEPAPPVTALTLVAAEGDVQAVRRGVRRGLAYARAAALARDLANAPPSLLTAERLGGVAARLGADSGLSVDVYDRDALTELGCGGLLGVNAGSADEPRMIKLRYRPEGDPDVPRLTLVGKGIMYDSGGISLKPADAVHATMKNDMSGAAAILAAMALLGELDCPVAVTGYLMCTDNMPSGSAVKLGDVLTMRGGTTVEVVNADAEGRLVMADALVLATEEPVDAIVDIATLTGACLRALGAQIAGVFGNDQGLVDQVRAAAVRVDEPVWQLPMARRYRAEMDSDVADIKNMGGANAAAIHAALFLEEFVAGTPWAHIDIAGTAQNDKPRTWYPQGCTGFGARLLLDLALAFQRPEPDPLAAKERS
ncbi:leucyl aminopeptidase [Catellatospora vulcania]|uniref:leucyl aminopeptidase n=1 Tax=Catellatospora vulcania TaxID=1460450 RepID=UPI0012D3A939|nr:leucyl aminopeptidase [Catellatospora vulcania]